MLKRARSYLNETVPTPRWFPIVVCLYFLVYMAASNVPVLIATVGVIVLYELVNMIRRHRRGGNA
jgi:hypothetical protein